VATIKLTLTLSFSDSIYVSVSVFVFVCVSVSVAASVCGNLSKLATWPLVVSQLNFPFSLLHFTLQSDANYTLDRNLSDDVQFMCNV